MGWSIDTSRPSLKKIFKEAGMKYRITHPQSSQQTVTIEYLGKDDITDGFKKRIAALFPDFVYIEFVLVEATPAVGDQQEWDN